MTDIIFHHETIASKTTLYKNRVEYKLAGFFAKTQTILLRNITKIETAPARNMTITTSDGQTVSIPIYGKHADELKQKIHELL